MILQVEEEWSGRVNVGRGRGHASQGVSVGNSFRERNSDLGGFVASSKEMVPKILETEANIGWVGAEGVYPKNDTGDKTFQDTGGWADWGGI